MIEANWGDTIIINYTNGLTTNGTTLHFHGMRQYNSNEMDGVASVTQCPLAPGQSMQYSFTADNYGTSWYHSHFSVQTYDGVFGPIKIHGPSTAPSGTTISGDQFVMLQDWSHKTVDSMFQAAEATAGQPTLDTGLINGLNVWSATNVGSRFQMNVVQGQTYKLRLVNAAIQSTFKFYIDGHSMQVISADFVPIVPYTTNVLSINIGQRYEVLVTFNQPVNNYWMRSDVQTSCSSVTQGKNIKGVVSYSGASTTAVPTTTAYTYTDSCLDEPAASLVPAYAMNVGGSSVSQTETFTVAKNSANVYRWTVSGTGFQGKYAEPTLQDMVFNGTVPTANTLSIQAPTLGEWVYVIVQSSFPPIPHPIHLHGHDFYILATGSGSYSSSTALNLKNPPRRDVAMMPGSGFLVIAFYTDNPGVWLMHCHIGWHATMGFAVQIIENLGGVNNTLQNTCMIKDVCQSWNTWAAANPTHSLQIDDGI